MKVRIYYDGYFDQFLPQYRKFGFWWNFTKYEPNGYGGGGNYVKRVFHTKEYAVAFLKQEKEDRRKEKESEAALKERAKKSGVVYEEIW